MNAFFEKNEVDDDPQQINATGDVIIENLDDHDGDHVSTFQFQSAETFRSAGSFQSARGSDAHPGSSFRAKSTDTNPDIFHSANAGSSNTGSASRRQEIQADSHGPDGTHNSEIDLAGSGTSVVRSFSNLSESQPNIAIDKGASNVRNILSDKAEIQFEGTPFPDAHSVSGISPPTSPSTARSELSKNPTSSSATSSITAAISTRTISGNPAVDRSLLGHAAVGRSSVSPLGPSGMASSGSSKNAAMQEKFGNLPIAGGILASMDRQADRQANKAWKEDANKTWNEDSWHDEVWHGERGWNDYDSLYSTSSDDESIVHLDQEGRMRVVRDNLRKREVRMCKVVCCLALLIGSGLPVFICFITSMKSNIVYNSEPHEMVAVCRTTFGHDLKATIGLKEINTDPRAQQSADKYDPSQAISKTLGPDSSDINGDGSGACSPLHDDYCSGSGSSDADLGHLRNFHMQTGKTMDGSAAGAKPGPASLSSSRSRSTGSFLGIPLEGNSFFEANPEFIPSSEMTSNPEYAPFMSSFLRILPDAQQLQISMESIGFDSISNAISIRNVKSAAMEFRNKVHDHVGNLRDKMHVHAENFQEGVEHHTKLFHYKLEMEMQKQADRGEDPTTFSAASSTFLNVLRSNVESSVEDLDIGHFYGGPRKKETLRKHVIVKTVEPSSNPDHSDRIIDNAIAAGNKELKDWVNTDGAWHGTGIPSTPVQQAQALLPTQGNLDPRINPDPWTVTLLTNLLYDPSEPCPARRKVESEVLRVQGLRGNGMANNQFRNGNSKANLNLDPNDLCLSTHYLDATMSLFAEEIGVGSRQRFEILDRIHERAFHEPRNVCCGECCETRVKSRNLRAIQPIDMMHVGSCKHCGFEDRIDDFNSTIKNNGTLGDNTKWNFIKNIPNGREMCCATSTMDLYGSVIFGQVHDKVPKRKQSNNRSCNAAAGSCDGSPKTGNDTGEEGNSGAEENGDDDDANTYWLNYTDYLVLSNIPTKGYLAARNCCGSVRTALPQSRILQTRKMPLPEWSFPNAFSDETLWKPETSLSEKERRDYVRQHLNGDYDISMLKLKDLTLLLMAEPNKNSGTSSAAISGLVSGLEAKNNTAKDSSNSIENAWQKRLFVRKLLALQGENGGERLLDMGYYPHTKMLLFLQALTKYGGRHHYIQGSNSKSHSGGIVDIESILQHSVLNGPLLKSQDYDIGTDNGNRPDSTGDVHVSAAPEWEQPQFIPRNGGLAGDDEGFTADQNAGGVKAKENRARNDGRRIGERNGSSGNGGTRPHESDDESVPLYRPIVEKNVLPSIDPFCQVVLNVPHSGIVNVHKNSAMRARRNPETNSDIFEKYMRQRGERTKWYSGDADIHYPAEVDFTALGITDDGPPADVADGAPAAPADGAPAAPADGAPAVPAGGAPAVPADGAPAAPAVTADGAPASTPVAGGAAAFLETARGASAPDLGKTATPRGEAVPLDGEAAPEYEKASPVDGKTAPVDGEAVPEYGEDVFEYGKAAFEYGKSHGKAVPEHKKSAPEHSAPAGGKAASEYGKSAFEDAESASESSPEHEKNTVDGGGVAPPINLAAVGGVGDAVAAPGEVGSAAPVAPSPAGEASGGASAVGLIVGDTTVVSTPAPGVTPPVNLAGIPLPTDHGLPSDAEMEVVYAKSRALLEAAFAAQFKRKSESDAQNQYYSPQLTKIELTPLPQTPYFAEYYAGYERTVEATAHTMRGDHVVYYDHPTITDADHPSAASGTSPSAGASLVQMTSAYPISRQQLDSSGFTSLHPASSGSWRQQLNSTSMLLQVDSTSVLEIGAAPAGSVASSDPKIPSKFSLNADWFQYTSAPNFNYDIYLGQLDEGARMFGGRHTSAEAHFNAARPYLRISSNTLTMPSMQWDMHLAVENPMTTLDNGRFWRERPYYKKPAVLPFDPYGVSYTTQNTVMPTDPAGGTAGVMPSVKPPGPTPPSTPPAVTTPGSKGESDPLVLRGIDYEGKVERSKEKQRLALEQRIVSIRNDLGAASDFSADVMVIRSYTTWNVFETHSCQLYGKALKIPEGFPRDVNVFMYPINRTDSRTDSASRFLGSASRYLGTASGARNGPENNDLTDFASLPDREPLKFREVHFDYCELSDTRTGTLDGPPLILPASALQNLNYLRPRSTPEQSATEGSGEHLRTPPVTKNMLHNIRGIHYRPPDTRFPVKRFPGRYRSYHLLVDAEGRAYHDQKTVQPGRVFGSLPEAGAAAAGTLMDTYSNWEFPSHQRLVTVLVPDIPVEEIPPEGFPYILRRTPASSRGKDVYQDKQLGCSEYSLEGVELAKNEVTDCSLNADSGVNFALMYSLPAVVIDIPSFADLNYGYHTRSKNVTRTHDGGVLGLEINADPPSESQDVFLSGKSKSHHDATEGATGEKASDGGLEGLCENEYPNADGTERNNLDKSALLGRPCYNQGNNPEINFLRNLLKQIKLGSFLVQVYTGDGRTPDPKDPRSPLNPKLKSQWTVFNIPRAADLVSKTIQPVNVASGRPENVATGTNKGGRKEQHEQDHFHLVGDAPESYTNDAETRQLSRREPSHNSKGEILREGIEGAFNRKDDLFGIDFCVAAHLPDVIVQNPEDNPPGIKALRDKWLRRWGPQMHKSRFKEEKGVKNPLIWYSQIPRQEVTDFVYARGELEKGKLRHPSLKIAEDGTLEGVRDGKPSTKGIPGAKLPKGKPSSEGKGKAGSEGSLTGSSDPSGAKPNPSSPDDSSRHGVGEFFSDSVTYYETPGGFIPLVMRTDSVKACADACELHHDVCFGFVYQMQMIYDRKKKEYRDITLPNLIRKGYYNWQIDSENEPTPEPTKHDQDLSSCTDERDAKRVGSCDSTTGIPPKVTRAKDLRRRVRSLSSVPDYARPYNKRPTQRDKFWHIDKSYTSTVEVICKFKAFPPMYFLDMPVLPLNGAKEDAVASSLQRGGILGTSQSQKGDRKLDPNINAVAHNKLRGKHDPKKASKASIKPQVVKMSPAVEKAIVEASAKVNAKTDGTPPPPVTFPQAEALNPMQLHANRVRMIDRFRYACSRNIESSTCVDFPASNWNFKVCGKSNESWYLYHTSGQGILHDDPFLINRPFPERRYYIDVEATQKELRYWYKKTQRPPAPKEKDSCGEHPNRKKSCGCSVGEDRSSGSSSSSSSSQQQITAKAHNDAAIGASCTYHSSCSFVEKPASSFMEKLSKVFKSSEPSDEESGFEQAVMPGVVPAVVDENRTEGGWPLRKESEMENTGKSLFSAEMQSSGNWDFFGLFSEKDSDQDRFDGDGYLDENELDHDHDVQRRLKRSERSARRLQINGQSGSEKTHEDPFSWISDFTSSYVFHHELNETVSLLMQEVERRYGPVGSSDECDCQPYSVNPLNSFVNVPTRLAKVLLDLGSATSSNSTALTRSFLEGSRDSCNDGSCSKMSNSAERSCDNGGSCAKTTTSNRKTVENDEDSHNEDTRRNDNREGSSCRCRSNRKRAEPIPTPVFNSRLVNTWGPDREALPKAQSYEERWEKEKRDILSSTQNFALRVPQEPDDWFTGVKKRTECHEEERERAAKGKVGGKDESGGKANLGIGEKSVPSKSKCKVNLFEFDVSDEVDTGVRQRYQVPTVTGPFMSLKPGEFRHNVRGFDDLYDPAYPNMKKKSVESSTVASSTKDRPKLPPLYQTENPSITDFIVNGNMGKVRTVERTIHPLKNWINFENVGAFGVGQVGLSMSAWTEEFPKIVLEEYPVKPKDVSPSAAAPPVETVYFPTLKAVVLASTGSRECGAYNRYPYDTWEASTITSYPKGPAYPSTISTTRHEPNKVFRVLKTITRRPGDNKEANHENNSSENSSYDQKIKHYKKKSPWYYRPSVWRGELQLKMHLDYINNRHSPSGSVTEAFLEEGSGGAAENQKDGNREDLSAVFLEMDIDKERLYREKENLLKREMIEVSKTSVGKFLNQIARRQVKESQGQHNTMRTLHSRKKEHQEKGSQGPTLRSDDRYIYNRALEQGTQLSIHKTCPTDSTGEPSRWNNLERTGWTSTKGVYSGKTFVAGRLHTAMLILHSGRDVATSLSSQYYFRGVELEAKLRKLTLDRPVTYLEIIPSLDMPDGKSVSRRTCAGVLSAYIMPAIRFFRKEFYGSGKARPKLVQRRTSSAAPASTSAFLDGATPASGAAPVVVASSTPATGSSTPSLLVGANPKTHVVEANTGVSHFYQYYLELSQKLKEFRLDPEYYFNIDLDGRLLDHMTSEMNVNFPHTYILFAKILPDITDEYLWELFKKDQEDLHISYSNPGYFFNSPAVSNQLYDAIKYDPAHTKGIEYYHGHPGMANLNLRGSNSDPNVNNRISGSVSGSSVSGSNNNIISGADLKGLEWTAANIRSGRITKEMVLKIKSNKLLLRRWLEDDNIDRWLEEMSFRIPRIDREVFSYAPFLMFSLIGVLIAFVFGGCSVFCSKGVKNMFCCDGTCFEGLTTEDVYGEEEGKSHEERIPQERIPHDREAERRARRQAQAWRTKGQSKGNHFGTSEGDIIGAGRFIKGEGKKGKYWARKGKGGKEGGKGGKEGGKGPSGKLVEQDPELASTGMINSTTSAIGMEASRYYPPAIPEIRSGMESVEADPSSGMNQNLKSTPGTVPKSDYQNAAPRSEYQNAPGATPMSEFQNAPKSAHALASRASTSSTGQKSAYAPKSEYQPYLKSEQQPFPKSEQQPFPKSEQQPFPKSEQQPFPNSEHQTLPKSEGVNNRTGVASHVAKYDAGSVGPKSSLAMPSLGPGSQVGQDGGAIEVTPPVASQAAQENIPSLTVSNSGVNVHSPPSIAISLGANSSAALGANRPLNSPVGASLGEDVSGASHVFGSSDSTLNTNTVGNSTSANSIENSTTNAPQPSFWWRVNNIGRPPAANRTNALSAIIAQERVKAAFDRKSRRRRGASSRSANVSSRTSSPRVVSKPGSSSNPESMQTPPMSMSSTFLTPATSILTPAAASAQTTDAPGDASVANK